jgi:DNA-binding transcriptional LysR family regulator
VVLYVFQFQGVIPQLGWSHPFNHFILPRRLLGVFPRFGDQLHRQTLFDETFACVADAETLVDRVPDLDAWLRSPHVLLTVNPEADNEIDLALEQQGLQRHIALRQPCWGVASDMVAGTDLILTVARRNTASIALDARFSVFEPPLAILPFGFEQVWHARREHDPAHRRLRELLAGLAADELLYAF